MEGTRPNFQLPRVVTEGSNQDHKPLKGAHLTANNESILSKPAILPTVEMPGSRTAWEGDDPTGRASIFDTRRGAEVLPASCRLFRVPKSQLPAEKKDNPPVIDFGDQHVLQPVEIRYAVGS